MRVIECTGSLLVAIVVALSAGCGAPDVRTPTAAGAQGERSGGREAIIEHGCGSCHRIPGVPNASSFVGPPLDAWSERSFIAGTLPNSVENLVRWLEDPQEVRPGSAMPRLDLDDREIRNIAAYLFSLRSD